MSVTPHQVQQALVKSNAKYNDSAKSDIMLAVREFGDLAPDTESFMFPDGKRRTAFLLKGTIPVVYKRSTYNIPIAVYIWDTHPYYAPICFVRPTAAMVIKESENVNKEGRIFLPYLNEWRFPGYDLNGLLQVMAMVFQEKCPVFAKGSGTASSNAQPQSQASATPTNPPYPSASPAMPTPYPTSGNPYPAATPYPTTNNTPYANPYMNTPMPPAIPTHFSGATRTPPPIPPQPNTTGTLQPEHIRASMMSALEDKIKMRLREKLGTSYAEMASIGQTKRELQSGQQKLRQMVDELEKAQKDLENFTFAYQEKKTELTRALADSASGSDGTDIDSAIDATTPLHKQLLMNYAQDLACDDVIYALGQARIRGVLSIQEYLRQVRIISRRQFEFRATMLRCRRVAGLPV